ncbi:MAG: L,D-transpeptidase [Deltaproteobacteria bacterium]|nr:L,D-transpeptidase [Deltaproteobacteria bacterium]
MKRIVVNLEEQMVEAYEDDDLIHQFICVTGDDDHPTDTGEFKIFRKQHPCRSKTYDVQMDYAMFFTKDGKALHQYHGPVPLSVVRALKQGVTEWFGSHGCVRLEEDAACTLYEWAPLNTKVTVV